MSIALLLLLAVSAIGACSPKPVVATPEKPGGTLFALLPDPDSQAVGRVTVTSPAGSMELTTARRSTVVSAGQAPTPEAPMHGAEVQRIFGDALAALPPAPQRFVLYFQFDSDELTAESRRLLRKFCGRSRSGRCPTSSPSATPIPRETNEQL